MHGKVLRWYQFVLLMIASGIVKNDNQQLNMHEAGRIIPRGRVLCKRISRRTNPVSSYQNSSIVMAGMNPKMARIL
jgi:hypothetical protein